MLTKNLRLMIDTNVWMEYYTGFGFNPAAICRLVEHGVAQKADLLVSPSSVKDVFYLLPRSLRRAQIDAPEGVSYIPAAWAAVNHMLEVATAGPLSAAECRLAAMLRPALNDYEDNLLIASAETSDCDFIVTRDQGLIGALPEVCISPERALELLELRAER